MTFGTIEVLPVGDIKGTFFVPAYQRGYRWTKHEVSQLLDDIRESHGATYYLQPVVVKGRPDGSWELVDGQQRLTTLLLVFRYLQRTHLPIAAINYSIIYETREGSEAFLETLVESEADDNIDYFHMFQAYRCIEDWFAAFEHRSTHEATRFYGYLFENVKVLRYEAPAEVDSTDLFTRLNVGRIPLTDAELVKAMLLSRGQSGPGETDRALEMAAHWDAIERDLRVPEIWAFVTGQATEEPTHISLLLDTLAGGPRGRERPLFHTFETLRHRIDEDPQRFWRDVVNLHSLVLGWYEDRDLFHKVGYLIAIGRTFEALVALSDGKGRSAFEAALDAQIRAHLSLGTSGLADLTYTTSRTSDVLLLMNVETIRTMEHSAERYSFSAHAARTWSLEHIHAQNAEGLTTVEQWTSWLTFHRDALQGIPDLNELERASLLALVDEALEGEVTLQVFNALAARLIPVLSPANGSDDADVHAIGNLALLDTRDNVALSNSVFEVKRQEVIRLDKAGSYIPVCTRNIFLKYYTPVASQLHFWSAADRAQYVQAMRDVLTPYLQTENLA